ncbi:unnamed protein product [Didymodactylos carnosus]|uniref:Uncharacterized protein n=1 Tax=Didymodactylos carnosus TaxID=1234261 RepID=A0A8S2FJ87_9BILA|nr:unnamed protein product [Didymodactylos carnosus]CAF4276353.1 unnamed protein product [Didymodactylos carnosus]
MNSSQNVYSRGRGRNRNDHIASATSWNSENTTNRQTKNKVSDDEEGGYAVNLRLSPSIDGFVNLNTGKRFGGHNAFHDYISTITDNKNDQICDIWEKYFHVTLGQLYMGEKTHNEDKLQIVEQTLCNVLNTLAKNQPELPITLETNELKTISGQTRAKGRAETNFVVLSIKESEKLKEFWRFSNEVCVKVQREFKNAQVKLVQFDKVHITIRKYSNYIVTDNMKCIIKENPLQLTCSALDLVQGRDNARERFKINGSKKWWYGVTEIEKDDGKVCSGCETTITEEWNGYCSICKEYERIAPLWTSHISQVRNTRERK